MQFIAKRNKKVKESLFLGVMTAFCLALILFRIKYSGSISYIFLVWNLFLASVPWIVTSLTVNRLNGKSLKTLSLLVAGIWILFFPNAPYILTDLFHIKYRGGMPLWYDLVLILSFAWTGLLFGLFSLYDASKLLRQWFSSAIVNLFIVIFLFISSFGVYIGRYLRWNSWDIVQSPYILLKEILYVVLNPHDNLSAYGMTICFGLLLNMIYWTFSFKSQYRVSI